MRSVTMIAYLFPPEGNAGTYRPLRFVRQLSRLGWRTTVVTAKPYQYTRYDPALLELVPRDTQLVRVSVRDVWLAIQAWRERNTRRKLAAANGEAIRRLRSRQHTVLRSRLRNAVRAAEALYYRPDMAMSWIRPAVRATAQACARHRPDVIWATVGPVSSGLVARTVSRQTGVPYVLDFRDPWGLDYYESEASRPRWIKMRDRRTMHGLLRDARAVVFLFEAMAESYSRAYPDALDPARIHVIPNGFEGALDDPPEPVGRCTVVYTGTLSTYRYDTLLQAVRALKDSDVRLPQKLRFRFVGECTDDFAHAVETLGLSDVIETEPAVPHHRVVELQRSAHVLLLLGRDSTRKGHELVAGAKLFEYLKSRRPILAVLPDDQGRRILDGAGVATICDVDSRADVASVLRKVLDCWSAGTLSALVPDRAACESYAADRQTASLIRALEGQVSATPFVPGAVNLHPTLTDRGHLRHAMPYASARTSGVGR